jgi:hypothetical protein
MERGLGGRGKGGLGPARLCQHRNRLGLQGFRAEGVASSNPKPNPLRLQAPTPGGGWAAPRPAPCRPLPSHPAPWCQGTGQTTRTHPKTLPNRFPTASQPPAFSNRSGKTSALAGLMEKKKQADAKTPYKPPNPPQNPSRPLPNRSPTAALLQPQRQDQRAGGADGEEEEGRVGEGAGDRRPVRRRPCALKVDRVGSGGTVRWVLTEFVDEGVSFSRSPLPQEPPTRVRTLELRSRCST